MKKISVIVPVYFNVDSLLPLFEVLSNIEQRLLNDERMALELIFVDDGSEDDHFQKLK